MVNTGVRAIVLDDNDDVAIALSNLKVGTSIIINVNNKDSIISLCEGMQCFHKFAIHDIEKGKMVIKYGQSIGLATANIKTGEHVHSHNLVSVRGQTHLKTLS